jgi:hypothetical protein
VVTLHAVDTVKTKQVFYTALSLAVPMGDVKGEVVSSLFLSCAFHAENIGLVSWIHHFWYDI